MVMSRLVRRVGDRRMLPAVLAWLIALGTAGAAPRQLQLEIQPEWNGVPLVLNRPIGLANLPGFSVSRVDALLSGLALQREDGTWLESQDWFVHLSAGKQKWTAKADGLPSGVGFRAVRFQVGLPKRVDDSDPNLRPPDHPLHPDVCGLHWGWQGGYVFCALEGHFLGSKGENSGFSYHLAGATEPMWIELPVRLNPNSSATVRLGWDLAAVLEFGEIARSVPSTHSRAGDPTARLLASRVSKSFAVRSVHDDLFQAAAPVVGTSSNANSTATPFPLQVSQRLPRFKLPADNPLSVEGVAFGRRLFHDPRLSRNDQQSCSSCHIQARGFAEPRTTSVGTEGQPGRRNAMSLVNLAWAKEFFWDGRAGSLREQVLMPIQDRHEMNETLDRVVGKLKDDPEYGVMSARAFGPGVLDAGRLARALEQFLLTLVSQDSKFDRAARRLETLSAQERRGLELFTTEHDPARGLRGADCFHCHGGNLFTNHDFMNNGLPERDEDLGRFEITRQASDRNKFKVPSLRNVGLTAPYMHDGRFATLEEVIDHYNGPMARTRTLDPNLAKHPQSGLGLSADDRAALVAFLRTLSDETLTATVVAETSTAGSTASAPLLIRESEQPKPYVVPTPQRPP